VFVFLSGTSAVLYGIKLNDSGKLARYLFTRGLLLVVLELTIIRFCWTFNFDFSNFTLAGVIWMLGWCMILLAAMVKLSPKIVGIAGILIIFFQNLFALVPQLLPESARASFGLFWEFIYSSGLEGPPITILYVIVPWIGVMMAGYGFGAILLQPMARRKTWLIRIGLAITAGWIVAGAIMIFSGEPAQNEVPFLFRLMNQQKYPASQLFLMMTLGPSILLMAFVEDVQGKFSDAIRLFGRVPFFYYLLHIPLIHVSALLVQLILFGGLHTEGYATAPYTWLPDYQWSLGVLYLVFLVDVVILYFACSWYDRYKFSGKAGAWVRFV